MICKPYFYKLFSYFNAFCLFANVFAFIISSLVTEEGKLRIYYPMIILFLVLVKICLA